MFFIKSFLLIKFKEILPSPTLPGETSDTLFPIIILETLVFTSSKLYVQIAQLVVIIRLIQFSGTPGSEKMKNSLN
jgi:hypothetical protein